MSATITRQVAIKCGHCGGRHASVDDVRDCAYYESAPQEICCFSCDALIGWADPDADAGPRGCGGYGICRRDFPASF